MSDNALTDILKVTDVPAYPDVPTYINIQGGLHIWEGDGWKRESLAWKEGCYVASNLSGVPEFVYEGPQAQELLSRVSINNVYDWAIGSSKHLVQTDENGYIASHGLAIRDGEQSFRQLASYPWPASVLPRLGLDVQISMRNNFILQVAGPTSLQVLERLIGEQLRDVPFLGARAVRVPGIDADVEIELSRIGMAYTLAYELRGPFEHSAAVFDAVYRAGQDFGIQRSGWRTYVVNHTEGGFPQVLCTFLPSVFEDAPSLASPAFPPFLRRFTEPSGLSGSIPSSDLRARFRTPYEANWGWMAKFDHDFLGRDVVQAESANPRRKTVTLVWNKDDVLDVFRSQFEPGEEYRLFEFPTTPQPLSGGHADLVTRNDEPVGVSSVAVYSYYFREMISHSTIDVDQAQIGNQVVVHWGDHGARIKPIRATVERFPYLDLPSNRAYDLTGIPSGVAQSR